MVTWLGQETVATLAPDGKFRLTLDGQQAGAAVLETSGHVTDMWLTPGDDLIIAVDATAFSKTITYVGVGADANTYRAADVLATTTLDAQQQQAASWPPTRFSAWSDSVHTASLNRLEQAFPNPASANRLFYDWQRATYNFDWANARLRYARSRAYTDPTKQLPAFDPFFRFLRDPALALNQVPPLHVTGYRYFLPEALRVQLMAEGQEASSLNLFHTVGTNRTVRAADLGVMLGDVVMDALRDPYTEPVEADSLQFLAASETRIPADYRQFIARTWVQMQLTQPGTIAPELTATTLDGDPFKWADVRGKVVYVDFWASWCGPCRAEMPAADKLHKALSDKGRQVVFLNVSVDVSADNWRKNIPDSYLNVINVHSPGDGKWSSPALKAYGISSIPRYVLIGPDGHIVSGNAPRPSGGAEAAIRAVLKAVRPTAKK